MFFRVILRIRYCRFRMLILRRKLIIKPKMSDILRYNSDCLKYAKKHLRMTPSQEKDCISLSDNGEFRFPSMKYREFSDRELSMLILAEYLEAFENSRIFFMNLRDAKFYYYNLGYNRFDKNYDKLLGMLNELEFIQL